MQQIGNLIGWGNVGEYDSCHSPRPRPNLRVGARLIRNERRSMHSPAEGSGIRKGMQSSHAKSWGRAQAAAACCGRGEHQALRRSPHREPAWVGPRSSPVIMPSSLLGVVGCQYRLGGGPGSPRPASSVGVAAGYSPRPAPSCAAGCGSRNETVSPKQLRNVPPSAS